MKAPYIAHDTISEGSAASSNMPFATGAFYNGDTIFDPAGAFTALQLGNASRKKFGAFDTASLKSQDETMRLVLHIAHSLLYFFKNLADLYMLCKISLSSSSKIK